MSAEKIGVKGRKGSTKAGTGKSPGVNVPAIISHDDVFFHPRRSEPAILRRRDVRISANITADVNQKFISQRSAITVEYPRKNIHARHAVACVRPAFLFRNPHGNKSSIR